MLHLPSNSLCLSLSDDVSSIGKAVLLYQTTFHRLSGRAPEAWCTFQCQHWLRFAWPILPFTIELEEASMYRLLLRLLRKWNC